MLKFHHKFFMKRELGSRAVLLAGCAAAAMALSLGTPGTARADDDCGAPVDGAVVCDGDYPSGIAYLSGDVPLHVTIEPGVVVGGNPSYGTSILLMKTVGTEDVVLDAAGVTTSSDSPGFGGDVIVFNAAGGVTINGGNHSVRTGAALVAGGVGEVVVNSDTVFAEGEFANGINAGGLGLAESNVTVNGGETTVVGVAPSPGPGVPYDPTGNNAYGIITSLSNGSITVNTGAVTVTGRNAIGVAAFNYDSDGVITLNVTGDVTSETAHGAYLRSLGGEVTVHVGEGSLLEGYVAGLGVDLIPGPDAPSAITVTNDGTIRQTGTAGFGQLFAAIDLTAPTLFGGGPAVVSGAVVNNAGAIEAASAQGVAVLFDNGDDTLNLYTGSQIVGDVMGSVGFDTVNLNGDIDEKTDQQVVGAIREFEGLTVGSGYWTTNGVVEVDSVDVEEEATFEIYERTDGSEAFIQSYNPTFNVDGKLIFDSDDTRLYNTDGNLTINGSGELEVRSGAQMYVGSGWGFDGVATVGADSRAVVVGDFLGRVVIAEGGAVMIGATVDTDPENAGAIVVTGAGETGNIAGDVQADGDLYFNRSNDFTLAGDLSGSGDLYLSGEGTVTLAGVYRFNGTIHWDAGDLIFTTLDTTGVFEVRAGSTIDLSGDQRVGGLSGSGMVNVNGGVLTVAGLASSFGGVIGGNGGLTVSGGANLNLTGANTYTGDTTVTGATLRVNGSITSDVTVGAGGVLGGAGAITGDVVVGSGGIFSPGNSPGVTTVAGDVTFSVGSTYTFEVDPAASPDHDLIAITSGGQAILNGGTVAIQASGAVGDYDRRTVLTAITADGGVTGAGFTAITSSASFLTPYFAYGEDQVDVVLVNNTISLATVGLTANQKAVGAALSAAGPGDDLYDAVAPLDDSGVRTAQDALAGEIFATQSGVLLQRASYLRRAVGARLSGEGSGLWGELYGRSGEIDGSDGVLSADTRISGVLAGYDAMVGDWRLGASLGYAQGEVESSAPGASIETDSVEVGGYAAAALGSWRLAFTGAYARHSLDSERLVAFPGFAETLAADYEASTVRATAELAYNGFSSDTLRIEPFVAVDLLRLSVDGFDETGGTAGLSVEQHTQDVGLASIGVRLAGQVGAFQPRASLAYRASTRDSGETSTQTFAAGNTFVVRGADLLSNAAEIDLGLDWSSGGVTVGLGYRGDISQEASEHSAVLSGAVKF